MSNQRSVPVPPSPVPYFINNVNNTTTSGPTSSGTWTWIFPESTSSEEPHGPLFRVQEYLLDDHIPWLGDQVLSLRSWLWKLCR